MYIHCMLFFLNALFQPSYRLYIWIFHRRLCLEIHIVIQLQDFSFSVEIHLLCNFAEITPVCEKVWKPGRLMKLICLWVIPAYIQVLYLFFPFFPLNNFLSAGGFYHWLRGSQSTHTPRGYSFNFWTVQWLKFYERERIEMCAGEWWKITKCGL